ncbi:MAG: hypothetical protein ACXVA3_08385 [Vulcanimicrobiaceae bacterium]
MCAIPTTAATRAIYANKALSATQVLNHYNASIASSATPAPTAAPSSAPSTPSPVSTSTPQPTSGTVVWKAGDPNLGQRITANTYQCGNPVDNGTQFTFNLVKSGTSCGRNQANPTDSSGNMVRLADGKTYTWTFQYVDGKPDGSAPGMGYDTDARAILWQINPYGQPGNHCTDLHFSNGGTIGTAQIWNLSHCNGIVWTGSYKPGEVDNFKIVVTISQTSSGHLTLYRNGTQVASVAGPAYSGGSGYPWWNFGPYKYTWEAVNTGMAVVNATFNNMVLTSQ